MTPIFRLADLMILGAGKTLEGMGFGPVESPSRVIAETHGMRVRLYEHGDGGERPGAGTVLILPSPIKRPYVWDLTPPASAVRRFLERGLRVGMAEFVEPDRSMDGFGLDDHAHRFPLMALDALAAIDGPASGGPVTVTGHSLGGSLAAVFAARHPERVDNLLIFDAPLRFGPDSSPLAAWVSAMPHASRFRQWLGSPIPGSYIDLVLSLSAPLNQQFERMEDRVAALMVPGGWLLHTRLERWFLDSMKLPGRLFEDVMERLYRHDELGRGTLEVAGREVGLDDVRARTLMVVNLLSQLAPDRAIEKAKACLPRADVLPWSTEPGAASSHVAALAGPLAHRELWPRILDWMDPSADRAPATDDTECAAGTLMA